MKKQVNTYLAIALTTYCNYKCFYCKEGGESITKEQRTIPFDRLRNIIKIGYEIGIKNFRITGGEPTTVSYFGELIEYIMKFDGTKIRINTNGFDILKYIDVLTKYRERLDIVFSVDGISQFLNGQHFPKYLSEDVINITRVLKENGISVRYNIVVTRINEKEIRKLVLKAIDELHINVKLLDLNLYTEYFGKDKKLCGNEATEFWSKLYTPMRDFSEFLSSIANDSQREWTTGLIGKGNGIPMSVYFRGDNWVQVKDSSRGARYTEFCKKDCKYYRLGECQEGVFSLLLSSNLTLHLSGCKNENLYFSLDDCGEEEIKEAFSCLLKLV